MRIDSIANITQTFADGSNVTAGNMPSVTGYTLTNTTNSNGSGAKLEFSLNNGSAKAAIAAEQSAATSSSLNFYTENSGTFAERMRIDSSGSVGIGVADGDVTNDGTAARTYVGIIGTANRGRLNIGTTASNGADAGTLVFTNGTNSLADLTVDTTAGVQNTGTLFINGTRSIKIQAASGDEVVFNESHADVDFRVESDGNANMLFVEASTNKVAIGTGTTDAGTMLTVGGAATFTGQNTAHGASRLKIGQDTTAISQLRAYGANTSTAGILQFTVSSSDGSVGGEAMRIDSDGVAHFNGDVKVLSGDIQMGSGRGINFTASSNASGMSSETLDDYEEGTFTPTLGGGTTAGSFTAGSGTAGRYVKVGKMCMATISLRACTVSGAAGALTISGLPFNAYDNNLYSTSGTLMMHSFNFNTDRVQSLYMVDSKLYGIESINGTSWQDWAITNSSSLYLHVTICFEVDE